MTPADVQVLFCDIQPSVVANSKTNPPDAIARSAGVLAEVATILGLPVWFSVVPDGGKAPVLIPELAKYAGVATSFPRVSASPFLDAATRDALASTGRKTLVIAGFATEVVVVHAVLAAVEAGYHAVVPVDACGGHSDRTEAAAFRQIEAAGGVTTSVVGLVTALAPDFSKPPGDKTFAALEAIRSA